jgi:uncharacterized protein YfaS (alpha-2-macroglobulin family)
MSMSSRSWVVATSLALVAIGCGSKKDGAASSSTTAPDKAAVTGKGGPKRIPLTADRLKPTLHALGPTHAAPTSIVIELAVPVNEGSGGASSETKLKLTPELPGSLSFTGPSELTFTPAKAFTAGEHYEVELVQLATVDGPLKPPTGESWKLAFDTPAFKFLGWAPLEVDAAHHRAVMQLQFSAPILPNLAKAALALTADGAPIKTIAVRASRDPYLLTFELADPALHAGSQLAVAATAKLPAASGATLDDLKASYTLGAEGLASVKTARAVEGASGFYVEVVCDDKAAAPGERYYYQQESFSGLSRRCQLSDEALGRLHFEPAVKGVYVTAGSAGFRVFGDFHRGAYTMSLEAGATTIDGGTFQAPFSRAFAVSLRKPKLSFAASGRYLPRTAWSELGVKHVNLDQAELVVRQVPLENLTFWLGNSESDVADDRTSDVILDKTVALHGATDAQATTWLDVASLLPATTRGVLELRLDSGGGQTATSRLLLTNLSLVAKKTSAPETPWRQRVQVWALDMDTARLVDGVEVKLVRKSGKSVGSCTTSGGQGCQIEAQNADDPDHAEPFALIARKGDDLTYLRYQDLKADVAESSTGGAPYVGIAPYRAAVYADRGVFRPGDTAHVVAIVRDGKDRAPDQPLPVDVEVIDPRTKTVRHVTLPTNPGGVIAFDQPLPAFADTGHWRVNLSVADKPLAAYDLLVEEFVPERLRVDATPAEPEVAAGAPVAFNVDAAYLFGGSAMDAGVELTCELAPARFTPKDNADLVYGVAPKGKAVNLGAAKDQLDPKGQVKIACPSDAGHAPFTQTGQLTGTVSVLEAGSGRATVRTATALVHPERYYLGLRTKATRAAAGEPIAVDGKVVDWAGKLAPGATTTAHVELLHLEADYGYGADEDSGEARYDRWLRAVPEGRQDVTIKDGAFHLDVTPGQADVGYVIRVTSGKAKTELTLDGSYPYEAYGYGDGERTDQTPRPAKATALALELPKEIQVGAPATVKVIAPYKGRVLWTVETDHVVTAEWADLPAGAATWSFTLKDFAPNVYVSAFVVKDPHLESKDAFLPDRAFGLASTTVTPTGFTQEVKLDAPKEVRSSSDLTVTLDLGPGAAGSYATVAVVDEGILSLTRFKSPAPLTQLFAKRALAVETYETIGWTMLHLPSGASSRTGGGDGDGVPDADDQVLAKGRVQPVKPVALFSGVVAVGADGKAKIPFHLPPYRGEVRIMAVTASATKIGHAEAHVAVRDPLVVQATFPRFLTQNDQVMVPVFLTNTTAAPMDVQVSLATSAITGPGIATPTTPKRAAPLEITGKTQDAIHLGPNHAETMVFQVTAKAAFGAARLTVTAKSRGSAGVLETKDELEVPLLPAGPRETVTLKVPLKAGKLDVAALPALKGWVPGSETTSLWMTNNPYGEALAHLDYLVHYPYGCIEQTTSTTRPLIHLAGLIGDADPALAELKLEDMVLAGIGRVFAMETPSGGFGYWPGDTEPLEWATAYATDMLLDAKAAGYAVPADRLANVITWIEARVAQYERGQQIKRQPWSHYDEQAEAYLHYVLARAGKAHKARIATLLAALPKAARAEQAEDRYLLEAALYLAGDRRFESDLKAVDAGPIAPERVNSWSFYSDLRRRGMMLSIYYDLFGNGAEGGALADRLGQALTGQASRGYNTQELVWGVTALGKWVSKHPAHGTAGAAALSADGATIAPVARIHAGKAADRTWSLVRASEYGAVSLDVPASADGMWLMVNAAGVRASGEYKVGGNGLAVRRTFHTLDGNDLDPAAGTLKLGDLLYVVVEVENTSGADVENLALVDRLPAGFEIENPRLGRTTKPDWIKDDDQWTVDFMNLRDDHLEAFGRLPAKAVRQVVYTVRAVTSGTFTQPPIELEAMYDATLWARAKGGAVTVGGPWAGKTM